MRNILVFILLSCLLSLLLFINLHFLEGIPHVPDSASYLFMAKMLASGSLNSQIPIDGAFVDFFPGILTVSDNSWHFQYTYGHPLVLSLGVLVGFPQIIPPLVGTLMIFFLYVILQKTNDRIASYMVLILPFLSPFFLTNASSFMGHNTAAFYLSGALLCLILAVKRNWSYGFLLSGIFIGLLFNTRPLTALPFAASFFIFISLFTSKKALSLSLYSLGVFLLIILWLIINFMVSGNMFHSSYYAQSQGFFQSDSDIVTYISERGSNSFILLSNFFVMMYNIPSILLLPLLLIPFIFRKDTIWDKFYLINILSLPLVYFFYNGTFLMYGPRFIYEIVPFVFLLSARSLSICWKKYKTITTFSVFFLAVFAMLRYFSVIPSTNPDMMSPLTFVDLQSFNSVDSRIIQKIKDQKIDNALVFVKSCDINWWCYGSVFPQNNPSLSTPIVYVKDLGRKKNTDLMSKYPFRSYYIVDYEDSSIKPY